MSTARINAWSNFCRRFSFLLFVIRRVSSGTALLAVAFLTTLFLANAPAATRADRASALRLHLKFDRVATDACCQLLASKQYMLLLEASYPPHYVVFDDASGKRWAINMRGCPQATALRAGLFGAPWVMFECQQNSTTSYPALYNVVERTWHAIPGLSLYGGERFVVGSDWIEGTYAGVQDCGDHIHFYCGEVTRFFNIHSGTFRSQPTLTPTATIDLNSPRLVRSLCRPLHTPSGRSLAVYRSFALVFGASSTFLNNAANTTDAFRGWNAELCGSRKRVRGTPGGFQEYWGALTANDHAVLGAVLFQGFWTGEFAGRFLPSRRPFTGSVPGFNGQFAGTVVLDSSRLYVADANGTVWAARFPAAP